MAIQRFDWAHSISDDQWNKSNRVMQLSVIEIQKSASVPIFITKDTIGNDIYEGIGFKMSRQVQQILLILTLRHDDYKNVHLCIDGVQLKF